MGNSHGILDALIAFAHRHPNVILELKTKSANIGHLLKSNPPPNLICTWSLNPQIIVDNEERGSAPLDKRLDAARRLAERACWSVFTSTHDSIRGMEAGLWQHIYQSAAEFRSKPDCHDIAGNTHLYQTGHTQNKERGEYSQILKLPLGGSGRQVILPG